MSALVDLFVTCMSFTAIMTILSNSLIIITHIFHGRVRTCLATRYLVSLAVADLSVGSLVMVPSIIKLNNDNQWTMGPEYCKIWVTFDVAFCTTSIYHLLCISVDRFYAVYFPIKYATERKALVVNVSIAFSWLMGLVVSMPMHLDRKNFSNFVNLITGTECMPPVDSLSSGYVMYSAILAFILPTVILIIIYTLIFYKMRMRQRGKVILAKKSVEDYKNIEKSVVMTSMSESEVSDCTDMRSISVDYSSVDTVDYSSVDTVDTVDYGDCSQDECNKSVSWNEGSLMRKNQGTNQDKYHKKVINRKSSNLTRAELKLRREQANQTRITTMMIVIIVTFLLCWLPFAVMFCLFPFHFKQDGSGFSDWIAARPYLLEMITWIAYSNSWLNPIIYTGMNRDIRAGIANILRIPSKYLEKHTNSSLSV